MRPPRGRSIWCLSPCFRNVGYGEIRKCALSLWVLQVRMKKREEVSFCCWLTVKSENKKSNGRLGGIKTRSAVSPVEGP